VTWKNWASRKIEPKTPKYIASDVALTALNVRERKNRSGSIGSAARASQTRKVTTRVAPAISEDSTVVLVQPSSAPRTMP
jgi:hypothetical protein